MSVTTVHVQDDAVRVSRANLSDARVRKRMRTNTRELIKDSWPVGCRSFWGGFSVCLVGSECTPNAGEQLQMSQANAVEGDVLQKFGF